MRYFWVFVFPPIAVAMTGRPFAFLLNCVLSLLYFPGMLHALAVVGSWERERHRKELVAIASMGKR